MRMLYEGLQVESREHRLRICAALILAGCTLPVWSQSERRQTAILLEQQGKDFRGRGSVGKRLLKEQSSNPEPYAHLALLEARQEHYSESNQDVSQSVRACPQGCLGCG